MSPLNIIIKPTNACNLRCRYCYHAKEGYDDVKLNLLDIEKFLRLCAQSYKNVTVLWHGGEPMLMGLNFYRNIIDVEERLKNELGCSFYNSMQTNGTLITEEWIDFFSQTGFKIGISFDAQYNDFARQGTEAVKTAILKMQEKNFNFGILTVINSHNLTHLIEIYNYFNNLKCNYKFNSVFNSGATEQNTQLLINADTYVDNVLALFDYWVHDYNGNIIISNLSRIIFNKYKECGFSSCLFKWLCLDSNGYLYPCGRPWGQEYQLCHYSEVAKIEDTFSQPHYINLLKESITRRDHCIKVCKFSNICQGGCNALAFLDGGTKRINGWHCYVTRMMLEGLIPRLEKIRYDIDNGINKCYNPVILQEMSKYGLRQIS